MRISIECMPLEIDETVDRLKKMFDIIAVSKPYTNDCSQLVTIYIEAELKDEKKVRS